MIHKQWTVICFWRPGENRSTFEKKNDNLFKSKIAKILITNWYNMAYSLSWFSFLILRLNQSKMLGEGAAEKKWKIDYPDLIRNIASAEVSRSFEQLATRRFEASKTLQQLFEKKLYRLTSPSPPCFILLQEGLIV